MSETDFIKSLDASHNYEILTGNNIIKTLKINTIIINNDYNGTTNVSWILNEVLADNNRSIIGCRVVLFYRPFGVGFNAQVPVATAYEC